MHLCFSQSVSALVISNPAVWGCEGAAFSEYTACARISAEPEGF